MDQFSPTLLRQRSGTVLGLPQQVGPGARSVAVAVAAAASAAVSWCSKFPRGRVTKVGPLAELRQAEARAGPHGPRFATFNLNFQ